MTSDIPYLPISEYESKFLDNLTEVNRSNNCSYDTDAVPTLSVQDDLEIRDSDSEYIELLLLGVGMEKYIQLFESADVNMEVFLKLGNDDLIELGVTNNADRNCIMKCIEELAAEPQASDNESCEELEGNEDDLIMAQNVFQHLVEINSHITLIQFKLKKNKAEDYFVTVHKTALGIMKFVTNHALIQTNRISNILFDGNFNGINIIASLLKMHNLVLLKSLELKMLQSTEKKDTMKSKKTVALFVVTAFGILVCVAAFKKLHQ